MHFEITVQTVGRGHRFRRRNQPFFSKTVSAIQSHKNDQSKAENNIEANT